MTYEKLTTPIPGIETAVASALAQVAISEPVQTSLLAAGSSVELETGDVVWLACIVYDRPETPQIDLLTVAIACKGGTPWAKANGQIVASVWWSGLWPDQLARLGIDTARKALSMIALGEPQPQVDIPDPAEGGPTQMDAIPLGDASVHSIRTAITAATELAAPLTDVL